MRKKMKTATFPLPSPCSAPLLSLQLLGAVVSPWWLLYAAPSSSHLPLLQCGLLSRGCRGISAPVPVAPHPSSLTLLLWASKLFVQQILMLTMALEALELLASKLLFLPRFSGKMSTQGHRYCAGTPKRLACRPVSIVTLYTVVLLQHCGP